ncbi:tetratricopeptide repeat protein [Aetokthonos hydrillicola Thurmond2011]|jgi:CHAT domain-containing protein|uniref:Tetratricopeptide repeat protein n=2 Tax=Aetokthonos TaxID=1550243 RepID=A0AAP5I461_9CYAN|nr:CHAT domain-containing protein [Aetokthonos hydrillicola]MBO3460646.1 tetratricopeptide repeat protein [Aetokthonos hydrillicola CCALA 1050]MBW4587772.1 tetratricopeptide repeat protein [Aetokthonos hydrillicola CCALA 1050]MDR9894419.1 tetratricopeptide repeat protein [Aetokthonos hydrillicola Thurmond2011]
MKNPQDFALASQQCRYLYEQGRYEEALTLAIQIRDSTLKHLGRNHPYYAKSLLNLAGFYYLLGRNNEANEVHQELQNIQSQTAHEEDPSHVINSMNNRAEQCRVEGKYEEAEQIFQQALQLGRRTLGEQHPLILQCQANLASVYYERGQYNEAEHLLLQVDEIHRQIGRNSPQEDAQILSTLASIFHAKGDYTKAIEFQHKGLQTLRQGFSNKHPFVGKLLNNLAALYKEVGRYKEAIVHYQEAIDILCQRLGEQHPDFATSLNNLSELYSSMGNYEDAEPLLRQAMEIQRQIKPNHRDFATSLNNLADLYRDMGRYSEAEPLRQEALEIFRRALGDNSQNHPDLANYLCNSAVLHEAKGKYDKALSLYRQALEIQREILGENHTDTANTLSSLAELYRKLNDYNSAMDLLPKALDIKRRVLGENHPEVARMLNNLALIATNLREYTFAQELYKEALSIYRQVFGRNNPEFATILSNLANLHQATGNYAVAEMRCRQVLKIRHKILGEQHFDFASSLNNLAEIYRATGNYADAEPLYQQALKILHQTVGETHSDVATLLDNLSKLYVATGKSTEALDLIQEIAAIDDRMVEQVFSSVSERQRLLYLLKLQSHISGFLSLIVHSFSNSQSALGMALDLVLKRKAIAAEALAVQRDAVLSGRYPTLRDKLQDLATLRMQIAYKVMAGSAVDENLQTHQELLAQWEKQREQLEVELAGQIPEMRLNQQFKSANRHLIALALPKESMLVEFIRFRMFNFNAVRAQEEIEWGKSRYLAFVIAAGKPDIVEMIDLGEAEIIEQKITEFRELITAEIKRYDRKISDINAQDTKPQEEDMRYGRPSPSSLTNSNTNSGVALRQILFDPLKPAIRSCKKLFIAPDADLNRLPFEVLPISEERQLIDEYQIVYLSTGRDLLRFGSTPLSQSSKPFVVADPDFDLCSETSVKSRETTEAFGSQSRDFERSKLHFGQLHGTRFEGEQIAKMLGVQPFLGKEALETRLKTFRSPYIVHIATHGFFLNDQEYNLNQETIGQSDRLSQQNLENPLLRSGLALAGANTWLNKGFLPEEAEDGILTAEDVSGLDLLNTELVVLSACETGLGAVQAGEGVFGLRRAFVLAGAKTLVMSLWKVPDQQTQELMTDFYRRLLQGEPRAEALRMAQLSMKSRYPHSYYWGAFICQGNPEPLLNPLTSFVSRNATETSV